MKHPAVTALEFATLREQLRALHNTELASIFRVSRQTVVNWQKRGIPAGNQAGIGDFIAITTYIAEHGVQAFLESQFSPTALNRPSVRQCLVLSPSGGRMKRCTNRRMDTRGLCGEHIARVESGMTFMTNMGNLVGGGLDQPNARLPRRCRAAARGGLRCVTINFDGSDLCAVHKGVYADV